MSTIGLQPADSIFLIERAGTEYVHNALVVAISSQPTFLGPQGQPSITAIFLDPTKLHHAVTADWHLAFRRAAEVVHSSHPDWKAGRVNICYEERPFVPQREPEFVIAARSAHEANRILCALFGDYTQRPWTEAPDWQRDSACAGALHIKAHPQTTPAESHASWMQAKLDAGWTYGPVKDTERKLHPCLIPYEGLAMNQQAKDYMFGAVVRGALNLPQLDTLPAALPLALEPSAAEIAELNAEEVPSTPALEDLGTPQEEVESHEGAAGDVVGRNEEAKGDDAEDVATDERAEDVHSAPPAPIEQEAPQQADNPDDAEQHPEPVGAELGEMADTVEGTAAPDEHTAEQPHPVLA